MARRFFLLLFLFFSHSVTVQSVIYELKGQQVQFDPDITGQPEQILWMHNGEYIVEFNGFKEQVFGSYKGRVTLNQYFAQLQISDLRLEDSGKYYYDISIGGKLFRKSYELEVIEKVAKPTITCQMNSDSSSTVSAVLLCSVELNQVHQSSLKFEWISKGNVRYGQQLAILLGGERDEEEYTCRVSNLASSETATFRAKDCHTDAGLSAGMIALIFIFTVIICVGLLILLCRRKLKRCVTTALKNVSAKCHSEKAPTRTGPKKSRGKQKGSALSPSSLHDEEGDGEELREAEGANVAHSSTEAAPAGLDQISFQIEGRRSELDEQPRPSSPLLGQLDTTLLRIRERRERSKVSC